MGTLTLSGVLKRPVSGDVIPNARITFDAIATGSVVLKGVSSSCKTASDGTYTVDLEYGDYAIQVSWAGQTQQYGTAHIDDTTPIGSLNDLLMQEIMESQLTPEIILEFRQLEQEMQDDLAQMEQLNEQAGESATAAGASEIASAESAAESSASAGAAAASAADADTSAKSIEGDAQAAADSAAAAEQSEAAVAASAANAGISERNAAISEDNAAISASEAATSAGEASTSEVNAAISAGVAGNAQAAAAKSESNAASSEESAEASEINAENARDAAEEYAREAKAAASKVTNPLTDQGPWAIQSGYPSAPTVASIWQITDGGVDPSNSEIIWDPGDMLVFLATSGAWCRLLGQQTVAGEPKPIAFDSDIILNVGAGLQIVSTGTTRVDVVRLDTDNNLVVGDAKLPGIVLNSAEPTNLFVLVPDGNGSFTKSRIYSEAFPPPSTDTNHFVPDSRKVNGYALTADVELNATDVGAPPSVFSPDTPGSAMLAVIRMVPSDYPQMPDEMNTRTVLFPEDGYLLQGSCLSYGAMDNSGECINWGVRYFTGTWALLSGLVADYQASSPTQPSFGVFFAQSVDMSGLSHNDISSAIYSSEDNNFIDVVFNVGNKCVPFTAWKYSSNTFNRRIYDYCVANMQVSAFVTS